MPLKYLFAVFFALIIGFSMNSCLDNNNEEYEEYLKELEAYQKKMYEQYQADSLLIVDYLTENDSIADFDSTYGIFYNILEPGGETHPQTHSMITVKYKGMLLDGTVFDQTEADEEVQLYLNNLIAGWKIGVPYIGAGGKIVLYLPSAYGYGETSYATIPANSVLIFEIELLYFY
ncbi:MAG: FKBP-type peptidyl-prolyl cis-trans isomerase [Prolixibacteraceae bacterium]|nr:FKBP-type peptidyl-prolyl cis-trans isomerase [Prolixibacteraceae bacterium]